MTPPVDHPLAIAQREACPSAHNYAPWGFPYEAAPPPPISWEAMGGGHKCCRLYLSCHHTPCRLAPPHSLQPIAPSHLAPSSPAPSDLGMLRQWLRQHHLCCCLLLARRLLQPRPQHRVVQAHHAVGLHSHVGVMSVGVGGSVCVCVYVCVFVCVCKCVCKCVCTSACVELPCKQASCPQQQPCSPAWPPLRAHPAPAAASPAPAAASAQAGWGGRYEQAASTHACTLLPWCLDRRCTHAPPHTSDAAKGNPRLLPGQRPARQAHARARHAGQPRCTPVRPSQQRTQQPEAHAGPRARARSSRAHRLQLVQARGEVQPRRLAACGAAARPCFCAHSSGWGHSCCSLACLACPCLCGCWCWRCGQLSCLQLGGACMGGSDGACLLPWLLLLLLLLLRLHLLLLLQDVRTCAAGMSKQRRMPGFLTPPPDAATRLGSLPRRCEAEMVNLRGPTVTAPAPRAHRSTQADPTAPPAMRWGGRATARGRCRRCAAHHWAAHQMWGAW